MTGPLNGPPADEADPAGPVIRDRRRVDPLTGQVRHPEEAAPGRPPGEAAGAMAEEAAAGDVVERELAALAGEADAYRADLQRVQAEYANYRKRVERDREVVRDAAVGGALAELLPVLDDVGRADQHGELTGGFKVVADALDAALVRIGLERFGAAGRPVRPGAARGPGACPGTRGRRARRAVVRGDLPARVPLRRTCAAPGPRRGRRLWGLTRPVPPPDPTRRGSREEARR